MAEPTDAALAASVAGGDTGAFEILVRRHYAAVWRVAFLPAREEMAAEELTQDTFLRAYAALGGWRGDASLRTWLATICRRLCIDRARLKQPELVIAPDLEAAAGSTSETEALADRFDLRAALDRLPADDREAHGETADQQAQEHRPWPPVLDQQKVDRQQLGVQRRSERQREELGVHRSSALIGRRFLPSNPPPPRGT